MADCVAWCVEQVEGAVGEVVVCSEWPDLKRLFFCESDFLEFSTFEVGFSYVGLGITWVGGQFFFLEVGADDNFRTGWKCIRIADMVPVPVAPDYCLYVSWINVLLL